MSLLVTYELLRRSFLRIWNFVQRVTGAEVFGASLVFCAAVQFTTCLFHESHDLTIKPSLVFVCKFADHCC